MIHVKEVIVVEGKYDLNALKQFISGTIIETSGFGILKNKEKIALLHKLADKRGLIILTDSDKAGFFIRNRLKSMLADKNIKHAYIPDIKGKEKRKPSPSKEGKLGVEGTPQSIIINSLKLAGATINDKEAPENKTQKITKSDLYESGLTGKTNSAKKRRELLKTLNLPERLSANGLLDIINILYTYDEFCIITSDYVHASK